MVRIAAAIRGCLRCQKEFVGHSRAKYCSAECKHPSKPCKNEGCASIATTSTFCSLRCRNQYIGRNSIEKNKLAQNRPEVRLAKSIGQKAAFQREETQLKHKAAIRQTYLEGRESWNKGKTKETSLPVKINAENTSNSIQELWNDGHYDNFVNAGNYKKSDAQKEALSKLKRDGGSFQAVRTRYKIDPTMDEISARKRIASLIEEEFAKEGYTVELSDYISTSDYLRYICPKGHKGRQKLNDWRSGFRCKACGVLLSKDENLVYEYCKHFFPSAIQGYRPKWLKGKEIDIYIPEKQLGIEYSGLYWHSTKYKDKMCHYDKFITCRDNGIKLITLYSDEWLNKQDLVKRMIDYRLGISKAKVIRASECSIVEVSIGEERLFEDQFHIAGYVSSRYKFALMHGEVMVALLTYRRPYTKVDEGVIEIARYCNNYNYIVHGAFTKLLKASISKLREDRYIKVLTYSDCRFGEGGIYRANGFIFIRHGAPGYEYTDGSIREFRYKYRRTKELSERELTESKGLYPIYNCGNYVWELFLSPPI